jgi:hypothetical protein
MGTKGRWNFGIKTSDLIGSTEADDDTVLAGKQAREDAMNAMIESGLLDSQFGKHMWMESEEDVERVYAQAAQCKDRDIIIYRLPRDVSTHKLGGWSAGLTLLGMPSQAKGRVWLSFDGFADDRRELFQIPKVVRFCRQLLFPNSGKPDLDHAKRILETLFDEDAAAFVNGELVNPHILDAAGSLWLVGVAFHEEVYVRDPRAPTGWSRRYEVMFNIREWLCGRRNSPAG